MSYDTIFWTVLEPIFLTALLLVVVGLVLAVLAVPMLIVFVVVRQLFRDVAIRRRKAGKCEACGYQLAGLDRCPECGSDA